LWPVQLNEHSQIERDPVHYFITHLHNPGGEYKVTAEKKVNVCVQVAEVREYGITHDCVHKM